MDVVLEGYNLSVEGVFRFMDLSILSEKPARDDEWDRIWENCDYATYFHSREWAVIWKNYTKGKIRPAGRMIAFSDGASVLLPFSHQNLLMGFLNRCISSPAGTFGGWLSLDSFSPAHGQILHDYIVSSHQDLMWRLNPYDPIVMSIEVNPTFQDMTQVIGLARGFEAIYKDWTKGHMSAARKAQREGVIIKQADSIQDWRNYYKVYEDSLIRWGDSATSFYRWSLFKCMYEISSPHLKLWLAFYQGDVISGSLCFYAKRHVVYWHGASLSDFYYLRPANLLLYEIILNACNGGYLWFDFNPSGGHEGVANFKKSFGTQNLSCPVIVNSSKTLTLLKKWIGKKD